MKHEKSKKQKHTISLKHLDDKLPKYTEIEADSLEEALAYVVNFQNNQNIEFIIFDEFKRIITSKIKNEHHEYKHHEHGHHGHHEHGHHGHHECDDDDDSYA